MTTRDTISQNILRQELVHNNALENFQASFQQTQI